MSTVTADQQTELEAWYSLDATETTAKLGVDAAQGLGATEVESRSAKYGPNKFAET
ncbi:MAG TPA: cation-transporting P-type ATPase [Gaiellaceae bacterium]|nr:cation-transporting P-type ATPase [Gaiellaceae bacterium]